MLTEHKRVKHGEIPGQIHRRHVIRMRESNEEFDVFPWQTITQSEIKSLRRYISEKSKTVQRRRDKKQIEDELLNNY